MYTNFAEYNTVCNIWRYGKFQTCCSPLGNPVVRGEVGHDYRHLFLQQFSLTMFSINSLQLLPSCVIVLRSLPLYPARHIYSQNQIQDRGTVARGLASRLREPCFKSCAAMSKLGQFFHSTLPQFTQLYKYMTTDSGGYLCMNRAGSKRSRTSVRLNRSARE